MNEREKTLLVVLGLAGVAYWLWNQSQQQSSLAAGAPPPDDATSFANDPVATVTDLVTPWKSTGQAATWLPALASAEVNFGLPTDLLARMAYQESRFREDIIRGYKTSSAGALGIMQMMPLDYPEVVGRPIPFTDTDVTDQINRAAQVMAGNYATFGDWSLALAAYNAGAGNVRKYGGVPPFKETQNYVAQVTADVPGLA